MRTPFPRGQRPRFRRARSRGRRVVDPSRWVGKMVINDQGALFRVDAWNKAAGTVNLYPQGGGFGLALPMQIVVRDRFRLATPAELRPPMEPELFCFEGERPFYPGFHDGMRWNGWAKPWFEGHIAEQILRDSVEYQWKYDRWRDAICLLSPNQGDYPSWEAAVEDHAVECYEGKKVPIKGRGILRLYPLGAGAWTWLEGCGEEPDDDNTG